MNPFISIGIYTAFQVLTLMMVVPVLKSIAFFRKSGGFLEAAVICVYILAALTPVAGALLPDSPFKFFLQGAGNIWLGFWIYFFGILVILRFTGFVLRMAGHKSSLLARRDINLLVSALCGTAVFGYGLIHAQNTVVREYDISIDKDAGAISDFKAVLIGDLHLSVNSHLSTIRRMVEKINEQNADVVLIAGDFFTSSYEALREPELYIEALKEIRTSCGTYAVYGNHDVEETLFGGFPISPISQAFRSAEMERFIRDCGFTILYDDTVTIADGKVQITGRVDGEKAGDGTAVRKTPAEVLSDVDQNLPVIVLEHEPVEFSALHENGADLALCGHTHAGQIFPGNLIVSFFNENAYGYKEVSGLQTIVTSGIGYYGPPMRVGTNSEITVVNIHFGRKAAS